MKLLLGIATLVVASAGCKSTLGGGSHADTGIVAAETACDPLAAGPITLGAVVGVGMDGSGTLYVDAGNGIFVSSPGQLIRQQVTGSGQSGATEYLFTFEPPGDDGSGARNLLVATDGRAATAMALGPTTSRSFLDQSDAGITALTLVDAATLAGLTLVNINRTIDYLGDVANGNVVLATVPTVYDSTAGFGGLAIFYGPPDAVAQRPIVDSWMALSSFDGAVTFLVDGTPYILAIGTLPSPDAGPLGGALTLEGVTPEGGTQVPVTIRSPTPTTLPADLSFTCLP
jgi:hypothetical protein